jgi:CO/xanthine dehydrogenase FAD-binding subunit
MIIEYQRPNSLDAALELLARPTPRTLPLGGGTVLNRPSPEPVAVVDLQALGLNGLHATGSTLSIGATVTLGALADWPGLQTALLRAIQLELNHNLRQVATVAGALVSADGRSGFAAALLALEAELEMRAHAAAGEPVREKVSLGDLLPLRWERLPGRLITQVKIPLNVRLAYEYVARTPADLPILCVAVAQWPSGRTRLVVGGFGTAPSLALDGPQPGGAEIAAQEACRGAEDEWASAVYRCAVAGTLARRCLENWLAEEQG